MNHRNENADQIEEAVENDPRAFPALPVPSGQASATSHAFDDSSPLTSDRGSSDDKEYSSEESLSDRSSDTSDRALGGEISFSHQDDANTSEDEQQPHGRNQMEGLHPGLKESFMGAVCPASLRMPS